MTSSKKDNHVFINSGHFQADYQSVFLKNYRGRVQLNDIWLYQ